MESKKIVFVCKINLNTDSEGEQVDTRTHALKCFWKREVSSFDICQPDFSENSLCNRRYLALQPESSK